MILRIRKNFNMGIFLGTKSTTVTNLGTRVVGGKTFLDIPSVDLLKVKVTGMNEESENFNMSIFSGTEAVTVAKLGRRVVGGKIFIGIIS